MFNRFVVEYNPYLAYVFYADIDLDTGKVFYKESIRSKPIVNSECFFLVQSIKLSEFRLYLSELITEWADNYNNKNYLEIDGYGFSIKFFNGKDIVREIVGANNKPDKFDDFIIAIESILQKDFSKI